MTQHQSLCAAFQATAARHPDRVALRGPGGATGLTWRQYADRVRALATGLAALGVRPGDTVAIMLTNIPEFHLADTAVLHAGATPFSIYNTFTAEQVSHLFGNAGNRVVVTETQFLEKVRTADTTGQVQHIICVDGPVEGTRTLDEVAALDAPDFDFDATWQAVRADDLLTIIYTSGTTGAPKGAELTHANLLAEFAAVEPIITPNVEDRVVSYLPDAHLANRAFCHYNNVIEGVQVTTVADPKQLVATLPAVRPTLFLGVPAIWYKIKAGIEAIVAAEESTPKRLLVQWAIRTGTAVAWLRNDGKPVPLRTAARRSRRSPGPRE
ncbi:AMP-binding protein [Nocardia crassostreae]|uniref:AMP-binding protein n=1 Tax=Nocardia crassostreae TaxID=53428 RepID=UPI000832748C|nr:AMP-binding protein [Nocardia crassostreae]